MKRLFNTDGVVYMFMTIIYRFVILNLLWCISSLPLITVGASTTALFYVAGKIVRKEEVNEFKDFIKGFRDNFRQGTAIWLILCGAYAIIFTNLSLLERYGKMGGLVLVLQLPVLVQVAIITVFVFPLLSRYQLNTLDIIKTSWILGIKHIFSCAAGLVVIIAVAILAITVPVLFLTVSVSLAASAVYLVFHRILEKYPPEAV